MPRLLLQIVNLAVFFVDGLFLLRGLSLELIDESFAEVDAFDGGVVVGAEVVIVFVMIGIRLAEALTETLTEVERVLGRIEVVGVERGVEIICIAIVVVAIVAIVGVVVETAAVPVIYAIR